MFSSAPRPLSILGFLAPAIAVGIGVGSGGPGAPRSGEPVQVVEAVSPASETEAAAGEELVFSVKPPADVPCSFDWYLDGGRVAVAGSRLPLDTSSLSEGLHAVSIDVATFSGEARVTSIAWKVRIGPSKGNGGR